MMIKKLIHVIQCYMYAIKEDFYDNDFGHLFHVNELELPE